MMYQDSVGTIHTSYTLLTNHLEDIRRVPIVYNPILRNTQV